MIGEKIRNIRKSKNLTIIELAEQIKVTSGYISQIERNLIDPSLSVLRRLSKALDTPLSVLFADEAAAEVVIVGEENRTTIKFGNINVEYEYITPFSGKGGRTAKIEAFKFCLPPGEWCSSKVLIHEAEQCIWVIKGELEYHSDETVHKVHEGGSIYISEDKGHMIFNPADKPAEALCILSPSIH